MSGLVRVRGLTPPTTRGLGQVRERDIFAMAFCFDATVYVANRAARRDGCAIAP
jgi:hypothetical protein